MKVWDALRAIFDKDAEQANGESLVFSNRPMSQPVPVVPEREPEKANAPEIKVHGTGFGLLPHWGVVPLLQCDGIMPKTKISIAVSSGHARFHFNRPEDQRYKAFTQVHEVNFKQNCLKREIIDLSMLSRRVYVVTDDTVASYPYTISDFVTRTKSELDFGDPAPVWASLTPFYLPLSGRPAEIEGPYPLEAAELGPSYVFATALLLLPTTTTPVMRPLQARGRRAAEALWRAFFKGDLRNVLPNPLDTLPSWEKVLAETRRLKGYMGGNGGSDLLGRPRKAP
jgi:hypothetical protein